MLEEFNNATNETLGEAEHDLGHEQHEPTAILFIFFSCALGAIIRTVLHQVRLPYTVVLMLVGCVIGLLSRNVPLVAKYTTLASLDPHTTLNVFLPVLIFESAFAMEIHMFMKSFTQIIILAVPGLMLATFLTCVFTMYMFNYNWSWEIGMMFGALASATDPVAVVALLKDVGASKKLGTIIEGESLLNDGAAIVIFNVFQIMAVPGQVFSGGDIALYFLRVALGGPALGFVMGKLTTLWLVNIFNDALTEITITLCSTYLTFYVGEVMLNVSGVLAVVVLGVTVSAEKTSISPEVEVFLHRFWEMLAYLANTLIFILVGIVITEKAIHHSEMKDYFLLACLYCMIFVIRGVVMGVFSPLLARIGYGLTWRDAAVMTWGGLRGAVGLALALIVLQNDAIDPTGNTQNKILLHCAGLVMLTLTINAMTVAPLLRILGMSEISVPKRLAMASAVRNLKDVAHSSLSLYMTDRFLADADWDVVTKYTDISDPYKTVEEEADLDELTNFNRTSTCPKCSSRVANEPSMREWDEMQHEARLRLLKAEKVSYWRQFEHGMLSREAVRRLVEMVDRAGDATDGEDGYINTTEVKNNWEIKGFFERFKKKLEAWQQQKPDQETIVWPENVLRRVALMICIHPAFDIFLYSVIMINVVFVILELVAESTLCPDVVEATYGVLFEIVNYIFIVIYVLEAGIKLIAYKVDYFRNWWNVFDFVILVLSIVDLVLSLTIFQGATADVSEECGGTTDDSNTNISTFFNPSILKIAKVIRLLRLLRSLRLVKALIPQLIDFLNRQINKKIRLGYDLGKGYVTGEEEVYSNLEVLVDNRKICMQLKSIVDRGREQIMKDLGMLQETHPGIAVSIKTQQAARRILNNIRDKVAQLRGEGVLDEAEGTKLELVVQMRMKKLLSIPATIHPPPPEKIIGNLSWVAGDDQLLSYIERNSKLVTMQEGAEFEAEDDAHGGIYVIISGLIKVDRIVKDYSKNSEELELIRSQIKFSKFAPSNSLHFLKENQDVFTEEKVSDFLSTGSVIGEYSLLSGRTNKTKITCDTSIQMYHIHYPAIKSAIEMFTDKPSLEQRLWKVATVRIALPILKKLLFFKNWSDDRLKMHLEKCSVILKKAELTDGGKGLVSRLYQINTPVLSDVLLMHGYAQNEITGEKYRGPCYIPLALKALYLSPEEKSVIAIIPRDTGVAIDEDKLVISEEEDLSANTHLHMDVGKKLSMKSSLCLQHAVSERTSLEAKASAHRQQLQEEKNQSSVLHKVSSLVLSHGSSTKKSRSNESSVLEDGTLHDNRIGHPPPLTRLLSKIMSEKLSRPSWTKIEPSDNSSTSTSEPNQNRTDRNQKHHQVLPPIIITPPSNDTIENPNNGGTSKKA